jgi:Orotidine 5'-phosphate decarboxylase / HUMPS family
MCSAGASAKPEKRKRMPYETRAGLAKNAMAKTCFELMVKKSTNLCVAVDTVNVEDVLKLAAQVGPYICVLKTHVDMFAAWDESHVAALQVASFKQHVVLSACFYVKEKRITTSGLVHAPERVHTASVLFPCMQDVVLP